MEVVTERRGDYGVESSNGNSFLSFFEITWWDLSHGRLLVQFLCSTQSARLCIRLSCSVFISRFILRPWQMQQLNVVSCN